MASARAAYLLNQRQKFGAYSGFSKMRVNPGSLASATNTIARQTVKSDLADMQSKYNDGLVSNQEMLDYLSKLKGNSSFTPSEQVTIDETIRNFNNKVREDALTAAYKNAPKGTMASVQAAQAIANYYQTLAGSQQTGTPAQSDSLQKAGQWNAQVQSEKDAITTQARKQRRAELFYQIAQQQPNTVDEAQMKAEAYQALASQAQQDGDTTEALQYATQAQNEINNIPNLQATLDKQSKSATRQDIVSKINTLANAYHDGKITPQEFASVIPQLDQMAMDIGDTSIQLSLNKWSDTLAKDVQKGVKRGDFQGLPVVLGKGGAGGSGVATNWDQQDYNYTDSVRKLYSALQSGKITGQEYVDAMAQTVVQRASEVQDRIQTLEQIAQTNPDTKVAYDGKNHVRVADALNDLYKKQDAIYGQAQAIQNGTFGIIAEDPSQFNNSGLFKKNGKNTVAYQVVDTSQMPKGQYVQDSRGIYHMIKTEERQLTPAEQAQVFNNTLAVNGNIVRVRQDSAGNYWIKTGKQYVNLYNPDTGQAKKYYMQGGENKVPSFQDVVKQQAQPIAQQASNKATITTQAPPPLPAKLTPNQVPTTTQPVQKPSLLPPEPIINAGKEKALAVKTPELTTPQVIAAAKPVAARLPTPQENTFKPASDLGITKSTPASVPSTPPIQMPTASDVAQNNNVNPQKLTIVGAPVPNSIQKMSQGQKPKPIQGVQGLPFQPKSQSLGPIDFFKKLAHNIFGF